MAVEYVTARAVKMARKKAGHTQEQAARAIGYARLAWNSWENGRRPMRRALLNEYRRATNGHVRR